jgi:chromosome segregation ATPase
MYYSPRQAEIVPFPSVSRRADEQNRMQAALEQLNEAVLAHRNAVTAWRRALVELDTVVRSLGMSMARYRVQLDGLNSGISRLHNEAERLERWADSLEELG